MNSVEFVSFVVSSVPLCVVFVDIFSAVGGILSADNHQERTEDGNSGDGQINFDPEVTTSVLNHSVRDKRRDIGGLPELAAPDEQSLLERTNFVGDLTEFGNG